MTIFLVWAEHRYGYMGEAFLKEIFSTKEKAEEYIDNHKDDYDYSIEKRKVC